MATRGPIKPRKLTKKERELIRRHYKVKNRSLRDELAKYPQYKQVVFYVPPLTGAYFPVLNPKEWLQTRTTVYVPLSQRPRNDLPASHQDTVHRYNKRVEKQLENTEIKEQLQRIKELERDKAALEHERRREEIARKLRERGYKKN